MISRASRRVEVILQKLKSPLLKSSVDKIDNYDRCGGILERLELLEDDCFRTINILKKIKPNLLKGGHKNKPPELSR